jgi:hypothetical protein
MTSTVDRLLTRAWRRAALVLLNGLVAFAILNVVCALILDPAPGAPAGDAAISAPPGSARYDAAVASAVAHGAFREKERFFPRLSPADVAGLMLESWLIRPYAYEPYTEFREGAYRGRFVRVDAQGFREGGTPQPWPPDRTARNVFVFGGSTIFGYGLPDADTVPAHLEHLLVRRVGPVRVYNFARGYYFSTQERVLFQQLLAAGTVPEVAVFVDGLNDFYNRTGDPQFTARLRGLLAHGPEAAETSAWSLLADLPAVRAVTRIARRVAARAEAAPTPGAPAAEVASVIARIRVNQRLIEAVAREHGVRVLFVWQPVPTYGYDLSAHPFAAGLGIHDLSGAGYPPMLELAASGALGPDFHSCAEIQRGLHEPLYLDQVHYTPRMAKRVARCIARAVVSRRLLSPG